MNLFATLQIKWKEPEAYREEQVRHMKAELARLLPLRPYLTVFLAVFCLAARLINQHLRDEPTNLVSDVVTASFAAWTLFYGLPWLVRRLPSWVCIYSNGIVRTGNNQMRSFKEMSGYSWSQNGSYYLLRITTKKGRVLAYGVPDPIVRDKVEAVLIQNGLKLSPT